MNRTERMYTLTFFLGANVKCTPQLAVIIDSFSLSQQSKHCNLHQKYNLHLYQINHCKIQFTRFFETIQHDEKLFGGYY